MRNFENWETQDLEMTFGLKRIHKMPLLENWLCSLEQFDEYTNQRIENIRADVLENVDYWNEDELRLKSISLILDIADFDSPNFCLFSNRKLSSSINGTKIGGKVDIMLSRGYQKPLPPYYFFVQQYKLYSKRKEHDLIGQLLAQLLVAQQLDPLKSPIYGCYTYNRYWVFAILNGTEYAVSNSFNASDDGIYKIISMLRKVKVYIERLNHSSKT